MTKTTKPAVQAGPAIDSNLALSMPVTSLLLAIVSRQLPPLMVGEGQL